MAEKSFTEKQREVVARKMGYEGPMNMFDSYLKSSPADARKYGLITETFLAKGGMVRKAKKPKVRKYAEGGSVAGLYEEILGRAPDAEGLAFWESQAASGQSLESIASAFQASPEAQAAQAAASGGGGGPTQGAATGTQSASMADLGGGGGESMMPQITYDANDPVAKVYQDVLGRAPDPAGYAFWKGEVDKGVPISQISAAVARSPEKTASLIPALYTEGLGREPDPEGLKYWQDQIAKGASLEEVKAAFNSAPEPTVVNLYRTYLKREPDPEGLKYWMDAIKSGVSLDQIRADFANSPEFKKLNPLIKVIPPPPPPPPPRTDTGTGTGTLRKGPEQPDAAQVTPVAITESADQFINTQLAPTQAATVTAAQAPTFVSSIPLEQQAALMTAATSAGAVQKETAGLQAAQGIVSSDAQVQAAQKEPTSTAVADLQAAQGIANQITNTPKRVLLDGELVKGSTIDQARINALIQESLASTAQGVVTDEMTVQGQLNKLYKNFEMGNPPAWAASSLRNANAVLSARGLGASSIAGQAVVQAALEAAMPIAAADAATQVQMGLTNLSNRQQMAVLTAQQRAQFLGQEFDQTFQTRVLNAAKISDIANVNFGAEVQITLENARLAQTMNLANLSNQQAMTMAKAAQIANLEMTNLTNTQQARVLNAQAFLQMDMANLANTQQTELFKTQANIQSIMSDTAAENAARQFNATSKNQTTQFFSQLISQVGQFNAAQSNAMSQFNVSQVNGAAEFNAQSQNLRDQFNAQNRLVIDQSNAQWRREFATINTAAINRANEFNATKAQEITTIEYNNQWQQFRDELEYSWRSAESAAERANRIAIAEISSNADILVATAAKDAALTKQIAQSATSILSGTDVGGLAKSIISTVSDLAPDIYDSVVSGWDRMFNSSDNDSLDNYYDYQN